MLDFKGKALTVCYSWSYFPSLTVLNKQYSFHYSQLTQFPLDNKWPSIQQQHQNVKKRRTQNTFYWETIFSSLLSIFTKSIMHLKETLMYENFTSFMLVNSDLKSNLIALRPEADGKQLLQQHIFIKKDRIEMSPFCNPHWINKSGCLATMATNTTKRKITRHYVLSDEKNMRPPRILSKRENLSLIKPLHSSCPFARKIKSKGISW